VSKKQALGTGNTIEAAIEAALLELGATRDQVDVEILAQPSRKGFLRPKSQPAQVRVSWKEQASPPKTAGTVAVVNGEFKYEPPPPGGAPPTIQFDSEVKVLYRGEQVFKEVLLSEGVEPLEVILPDDIKPQLTYDVVVDPSKTKAQLVWKRTPGVVHALADQAPRSRLQLHLIRKEVPAPVLSLDEVKEIALAAGLTHGLRFSELTPEALSAVQGVFDLAVGTPAVPGRDASIKYVFQDDPPEVDLEEAIRVDHYELHGTAGVPEGAILAVKTPAEPGVPGMDVFGQTINPAPVKDVDIKVGEGVVLSDDGLQAVAAVSGLPSLQGGVIRVKEVFELPGDADVSTGNITMPGDIIVRGNVLENVKVQSHSGSIVVHGLVSGATLRTRGSITVVRNVVRSQLYAGGASVARMQLLNLLETISGQLEGLIAAAESIAAQAENISFENLVRHLVELKFSDLPKNLKELTRFEKPSEEDTKEELAAEEGDFLAALLDDALLTVDPLFTDGIAELREYHKTVLRNIASIHNVGVYQSDVRVGYLQNSRVEASGTVTVTGQGCFYSTVLAGAGFSVGNGVFRGGKVTVESGTVQARELGGPAGISTTVRLLKGGQITARLVHPNVTICIGTQSYKFDETTPQVKAFLHEGLLTVYCGSIKIHG
jgi:predicted RNA-binding protein Jag